MVTAVIHDSEPWIPNFRFKWVNQRGWVWELTNSLWQRKSTSAPSIVHGLKDTHTNIVGSVRRRVRTHDHSTSAQPTQGRPQFVWQVLSVREVADDLYRRALVAYVRPTLTSTGIHQRWIRISIQQDSCANEDRTSSQRTWISFLFFESFVAKRTE